VGTQTASIVLPFAVAAADLHDPVFLLNPDGQITWANRAAADFLGRPLESLAGVRLMNTLTPESSDVAEQALCAVREGSGQRSLHELSFVHKDLSECRLELDFTLAGGANGQIIAIGRDISKRSALEKDRSRAEFQSLQFQAALVELARADSSTLEDRLGHITAVGASALDVGRLSVWLFNEAHSELRCLHLFNRDKGNHESGAVLEVDRYPKYFEALESQRTIAAHDALTDPLTTEFATDYLPLFNITSMLDVPIRREGRLVGVLCHEHTGAARRWKGDEQSFAASLADLIALVLETHQRREAEHELHLRTEIRAAELEQRVNERTAELLEVNASLRERIAERERAEAALRDSEERNVYLREELQSELNFEEIVGASHAMQRVFDAIKMVAETDATVLLLGETGTGKELIARALHNGSRRKNNVMVKVNCGALPENLIESELFGHEKGAFTGAVAQRKGRFELADEGTIFLDEIGELTLQLQTRLLRVLQEHEFERVGGSRSLRVNVRVIAATNRDLPDEVRRGAFRADLFYRLNVFPIRIPPLRERTDDIEPLATCFVQRFSRRMGKGILSIHRDTLKRLRQYHWPGNVRELANTMERAVILCRGDVLEDRHIATLVDHTAPQAPAPDSVPTLEEAERRLILQALERTGGVLGGAKGAAELLGINRSTLWSRMQKLGIQPPKSK
jgi:transcriptional regulator with GAF, ATPase, and Fis domain